MKARRIGSECVGELGKYDVHAWEEVFVYYPDEPVQEFTQELEVLVEQIGGVWMPFYDAMGKKYLLTDNYNEFLRESTSDEERARGYFL